jgi:hypothetical protein
VPMERIMSRSTRVGLSSRSGSATTPLHWFPPGTTRPELRGRRSALRMEACRDCTFNSQSWAEIRKARSWPLFARCRLAKTVVGGVSRRPRGSSAPGSLPRVDCHGAQIE